MKLSAVTALLLLVVAAGFAVRVVDLEQRTMGHPENWVPGLDVPDWVKRPPARPDLDAVLRTTLNDGHPPAYFLMMLPWVKLFGTGLTALRMPSVLLGAVSILLLFRVALRETDRWTALFAAALLAFHGHHVYWSQLARMYAPAAALGLLSTLLLWRLLERGRPRDAWLYAGVTTLALWTHLYCWPLVFAQIVWIVVRGLREPSALAALPWQLTAVIASSPVISLAVFQNPPNRFFEPVDEYFQFGYLYLGHVPYFGARPQLPLGGLWIGVLTVALLALSFFPRMRSQAVRPDAGEEAAGTAPPRWLVLALGVAVAAAMLLFALQAPDRGSRGALIAVAFLPLVLAVALAPIRSAVDRFAATAPASLRSFASWTREPSIWLALLPLGCMVGVSLVRASFTARGALVFTPFLSLAAARGVSALGRRRWAAVGLAAVVLLIHAGSLWYFKNASSTPRDYRGLAERMEERLADDDLIFVRHSYKYPPLYYHLPPEHHDRVVVTDWAAAAERADRVWVVLFDRDEEPDLTAPLEGWRRVDEVGAHGARALLYEAPHE